jgi:hypothetical protein
LGGGGVTCGEKKSAFRLLMDTPEGKRPLGRDLWADGRMILKWSFGR